MPSNSTDKLQDAIHKLEAFSRQADKERLKTPLKKAISLFRSLIAETFINKARLKGTSSSAQDPESILHAVEIVNRERLLIQKLKSGNPNERSLANSFAESIENYNKMRDSYSKKTKHHPTFKKQAKSFPSCLPKIDLLQPPKVQYHFNASTAQTSIALQSVFLDNSICKDSPVGCPKEKILSLNSNLSTSSLPLPQQSAELFQMKTLMLLERYGIASNPEARIEVKQSPIFTTHMPGTPKCTLSQTLALFPGQTIVVRGSSELDPTTRTIRKLFPETFSIFLESSQTGFPHPSQRAGWTLSNELLPHYPQRIDLLTNLGEFYQNKRQAAADLLPQGSQIVTAKKLIKLKRLVFNAHKAEMLALHHELSLAIIQAALGNNGLTKAIIDTFYEELSCHPLPYDVLAEVSQCTQELFVSNPYKCLLETVLKDERAGSPVAYNLSQTALKNALFSAQTQVQQYSDNAASMSERRKWNFVELMGTAFGPSSQNIMLQHLSEDLAFRPPCLNSFAQKIQSVAYKHVEDFLEELYSGISASSETEQMERMYLRLRAQIEWDIALFQGIHLHSAVQELAQYFDQRNQQLP